MIHHEWRPHFSSKAEIGRVYIRSCHVIRNRITKFIREERDDERVGLRESRS